MAKKAVIKNEEIVEKVEIQEVKDSVVETTIEELQEQKAVGVAHDLHPNIAKWLQNAGMF